MQDKAEQDKNAQQNFSLHPRLAADCIVLGELPLCRVLLMNDANYPWLILVPKRAGAEEVYSLSSTEQASLWQEVSYCGERLMQHLQGHKLNIATLGNMVPQLHVHVIVRQTTDPAWPGPVWGVQPAQAYSKAALQALKLELSELLELS